jgi:microcystin degradation protein MlrC
MLDQGITNVAVGMIWDPIAVQICMAAGEGAEIPLRFGAKSAPGTGNPIDGLVKVVKVVPSAEMRFGESVAPFGDAAHIHLNGIDIVLSTVRVQSYDPSLFVALGIDPASKHILVIKSTNHFYAAFSKIASEILYCAAGTPYPNNPAKTAYRHVRRDIWPIMADPHGTPEGNEAA